MQASGIAVQLLDRLGALDKVSFADRENAVALFLSCQDPADGLFKDPLETEPDHQGPHSWADIWGQRNGSTVAALKTLGAAHRFVPAPSQFVDLRTHSGRDWTLGLDWSNPWKNGETWSRAIQAFLPHLPPDQRNDRHPVLAEMFEAVEEKVLDPSTGMPTAGGCNEDAPRAMAGTFKLMNGYLATGRPYPYPEQAIDFTLALQAENGEFGYPRNMCMNWDALWVLRVMDQQLQGNYRRADIVSAAELTCACLMKDYLKADGGFAFHGEHCITNHHSVRLCSEPKPAGDMLGTTMCLHCLEYVDEWNGLRPPERQKDLD